MLRSMPTEKARPMSWAPTSHTCTYRQMKAGPKQGQGLCSIRQAANRLWRLLHGSFVLL